MEQFFFRYNAYIVKYQWKNNSFPRGLMSATQDYLRLSTLLAHFLSADDFVINIAKQLQAKVQQSAEIFIDQPFCL